MADPLDPFSAVMGRVSVRYTTAFVIAALLAAGICLTAIGAAVTGLARAYLFGLGAIPLLTGVIGSILIAARRPEMFKSERHLEIMKVFDWSEDPRVDDEAVRRAERLLPHVASRAAPKVIDHDEEDGA